MDRRALRTPDRKLLYKDKFGNPVSLDNKGNKALLSEEETRDINWRKPMKLTQGVIASVFIGAALMLSAVPADAMTIREYDSMSEKDRVDYMTLLTDRSIDALNAEGKEDMAGKLYKFFVSMEKNGDVPLGVMAFYKNLETARNLDNKNYAQDSNSKRLHVEHAFILTLKKNGIDVPQNIMTIASDFKRE